GKEDQMKTTSEALSKEMIYTKFLQGQMIIGVAGGIFDPVYVNRISDYAVLKYRRRFLRSKLASEGNSN
ncbi:MAG: EcsC family protein, partial [Firmicutes bacterium]|nr:EcsC family protein [Bacillota bacterium]